MPDWIIPILTTILGVILAEWRWFFALPFRMFRRHPIEGIWYGHFFSMYDQSVVFRIEKWEIKKGYQRHKFTVHVETMNDPDPNALTYKGFIEVSHNHLVAEFASPQQPQTGRMFLRFPFSVIRSDSKLVGISLVLDYDGQPSAHTSLLCKEELTEENVLEVMRDYTKFKNDNAIMYTRLAKK